MRRNLHVRLSQEAAKALSRVAAEYGLTVTSLIEALGRLVDEGEKPTQRLVDLARKIDAEHRSRHRD